MLTCEQCKGGFERPNSRGPAPKFCSNACRQAAHRSKAGPGVIGVIWRSRAHYRGGWQFRHSLEGRTYPPDAEFVEVRAVGDPRPVPRQQYF